MIYATRQSQLMGANVFLGLRFAVWGMADPDEVAASLPQLEIFPDMASIQ